MIVYLQLFKYELDWQQITEEKWGPKIDPCGIPVFVLVLKTTHLLLILAEIDHSDSFLGNKEQNLGIQGLHQELIEVYYDPVYQRLLIDRVECKKFF